MRDWTLDPAMLAFIVLAGGGYLVGVLRIRRRGTRWPVSRVAAFAGGLLVVAGATMSVLGGRAHAFFSVYMVQNLVLLMIAPLLLALGRPIALATAALPERAGARLSAVLASRPARLVTSPLVSPLLLAVVPFALYFTGWYQATLEHYGQYELLHLVLLVAGFVVQIPLWETGGAGHGFPYPLLLLFAFIELLVDAVPGIVLRLDTHLVAPAFYLGLHRTGVAGLLSDQQLGGDFLWCVAEAIDLPFLIVFLVAWIRADAAEAAEVDRELDTRAVTTTAEDGPAATDRPWWETDASVFGDRANQFRR